MIKIVPDLNKTFSDYKKEQREIQMEVIKQMLTLATAGFGLVAALAWNEAISAFFNQFLDRYLKLGNIVLSRFVYAVIVTILAVLVTYKLSKLSQRFKEEESQQ